MQTILKALHTALSSGEDAVLAVILETTGSTPRGVGAKMALFPRRPPAGTVGGGALEQIALRQGMEFLSSRTSAKKHYTLSGGEVSNTGMICGGAATLGFAYLSHETPETLAALDLALTLFRDGLPGWLTLEFPEAGPATLSVLRKASPGWAGLLLPRPSASPGGPIRYAEPISAGRCYVFGGGHVGQALVPILGACGFRPTVFDDRPAVADPALFPQAERVILGDFHRIGDQVAIHPGDYVVTMTHGHGSDLTVLAQVLKTPAAYIGCLGSQKKAAAVRQKLLDLGFSPAETDRVRSPVGLPIGGETPAEIAVSIAAQMIQFRTEQAGGRRHGAV